MKNEKIKQPAESAEQNKEINDYSAPLEQIKIERKKLEELKSRIAERMKFFNREAEVLALMKLRGVAASDEEIKKQYDALERLYEEIKDLEREERLTQSGFMKKASRLLTEHQFFTDVLRDFRPKTEH